MNKAFVREPDDDGRAYCPRCKSLGIPVGPGPLDTHVRTESRAKMHDAAWYCGYPHCEVAYFNQFDAVVSSTSCKPGSIQKTSTPRSAPASASNTMISKPTSAKAHRPASATSWPNQNLRRPTAPPSPPTAAAASVRSTSFA